MASLLAAYWAATMDTLWVGKKVGKMAEPKAAYLDGILDESWVEWTVGMKAGQLVSLTAEPLANESVEMKDEF